MGLETVELVMYVEESYGIDIKDEDANHLLTVQQLCDYIIDHAFEEDEKDTKSGAVFEFVKETLMERFNVPEKEITLEARFIEDLDLD